MVSWCHVTTAISRLPLRVIVWQDGVMTRALGRKLVTLYPRPIPHLTSGSWVSHGTSPAWCFFLHNSELDWTTWNVLPHSWELSFYDEWASDPWPG